MPNFPIVDSHLHIWNLDRLSYPWLENVPMLNRDYLIDEYRQACGTVEVSKTILDRTELPRIYDPSHPMADEQGYYLGSNVNLVIEIADSREAGRSYEANLKMFEQTRQMGASLLDILRR